MCMSVYVCYVHSAYMYVMCVGCGNDCPLETFLELLEPTIYTGDKEQWQKDCSVQKNVINGEYY